jgi:hypothetical protein
VWREFVELAEKREVTFGALCARFCISRKTGYKWLRRFRLAGEEGLKQRSRRPKSNPRQTPDTVVDALLALRREHADWSGARLRAELAARGVTPLPAPSTIELILRRYRDAVAVHLQELGPDAQRFEPNYCWVVRFGAPVALADGRTVVPMLVRDATTGFIVGVTLLPQRREDAMVAFVESLFVRHGVPWRVQVAVEPALLTMAPCRLHSVTTVWCMQVGVVVEFAAAEHAWGPGDEKQRLAARLASLPPYQRVALIARTVPADPIAQFSELASRLGLEEARETLNRFREQHNFGGKQEAMQQRSPISLYRPSLRTLPGVVGRPTYPRFAEVRLVSEKGIFTFQRRLVHVGRAFAGLCVELKPTPCPKRFAVLFTGQFLGLVDLAEADVDHTASLSLHPC